MGRRKKINREGPEGREPGQRSRSKKLEGGIYKALWATADVHAAFRGCLVDIHRRARECWGYNS